MKAMVALAVFALAAPALGQDPPTPPLFMPEVVTPDGSAAVRLPCAKGDVVSRTLGDHAFEMTCTVGQHTFSVVAGLPSIEDDRAGKINDFDYLSKMAQTPDLKPITRFDTIGSHRRITIGCRADTGPVCIVLVDRGSRPPLALAYTGNADAFADMSDDDKAYTEVQISAFSRSLRMID